MRFAVGEIPVDVNVSDSAALLDLVHDRLARGAGFAVATLNLDHLVKLAGDAAFSRAYAAHEFVVADGHPVVWMSRLAGQPVSVARGSELVEPLCALARDLGVGVALVGSTQNTLDLAGARLAKRFPGLDITARIPPSRGFDPDGAEADAILHQVTDSGARLCFLALGAPKQERLAARGRDLAPGVGFVSIGAGLDFIAGHQKRAPVWVRRLALEWLWRTAQDPRRMVPRYAACFRILPRLALNALAQRHQGRGTADRVRTPPRT